MENKFKVFTNPVTNINHMPFALECIGIDDFQTDYHHFRPEGCHINVFEYVISGSGVVHTSSGTFYPKAGDAYFLRAGEMQDYCFYATEPTKKIYVNILDTAPVISTTEAYGLRNSMLLPNLDISSYLDQMFRISCDKHMNQDTIYDQCFIVFLRLCQFIRHSFSSHEVNSSIPEFVLQLKNYIDSHLAEELTTKKCSEITRLSISQTIRSFRKAFGMPPHEYMIQQRMETAKVMLRSTQLSVQDIAAQVGFSDQYYFSRYFTKRYKKSPIEYRNYL